MIGCGSERSSCRGARISRKHFLIGSMAVAAAGARRMFAAPAGSVQGTPRLKLAVMSDIHVNSEASQKVFVKALVKVEI